MIRALFVALVVFVTVGCTPPRAPAAPMVEGTPPLTFEADETIDVATDWETQVSPSPADAANVKLTASDGTGIVLKKLDARGVIYGPLAFTELHLSFLAPAGGWREGSFSITLPSGASVSRFAMLMGTLWQESEVVELAKGRAAFSEALNRKIDPGLLEKTSGNTFRGRVFPIRGDGRLTEIVLAYTESLSSEGYYLPLRELPLLNQLDVQVLVPAKRKAYVLHRENQAPKNDYVLRKPDDTLAARGGDFAVVRVLPPERGPTPFDWPADLAVLIDTSASRAGGNYKEDLESLQQQLGIFKGHSRMHYAAFDQDVAPLADFRDAKTRTLAGATNFAPALAWAATQAKRVLVVTDGGNGIDLPAPVSGLERIDVLPVGRADVDRARALTKLGTRPGMVLDPIIDCVAVDCAAIRRHADFPAATHAWPSKPSFWHEFTSFLELPARAAAPAATVVAAPAALVERAVVEMQIRELDLRKDRAEIIALSIKHRILTPLTAMLALESDAEYARYGIPREAVANIPVVTKRGVEILPRGAQPTIPPRPFEGPKADIDPAQDTDGDQIPDVDDKCPLEQETFNGFEDEDGCPDKGHVVVEEMNIQILHRIHFANGSAEIAPEMVPLVDTAALTFKAHPEFNLIGVFGHTNPGELLALGEKRAKAVRDALVKRGVAPKQLLMKSFGAQKPLDDPKTEEGRAKNRRVDFEILVAGGESTGRQPGISVANLIRNGKTIPHDTPYVGELREVMDLIASNKPVEAQVRAENWLDREPTDKLAWIALGNAYVAHGDTKEAARAYGSLIDLAESPEQLRVAGNYLESVGRHELASAAYASAREKDPSLNAERFVAWSLARRGRIAEAFEEIIATSRKHFDVQRFPGHDRIVARDVGLIAAMLAEGKSRDEREAIWKRALTAGSAGLEVPITFAVLTWETDASDLDLVASGKPAEGYLSPAQDVKSGYGPELLVLDAKHPNLEVHVLWRGPSGFAMGKVTVFKHDGHGHVTVEDRPFAANAARTVIPFSPNTRTAAPTH